MDDLINERCPECGELLYKKLSVLGVDKLVRVSCSCEQAKEAERIKLYNAEADRRQIEAFKKECYSNNLAFSARSLNSSDFQPDYYRALKKYCENFEEFKEKKQGLLLYGASGTGKSYAACAVINALIEKRYKAKFYSYNYIINYITGLLQGKTDFLESLSKFDIIVIDDFACRKHTDFILDLEFDIINTIYENSTVLIITTNNSLEFFSKPKILGEKRINSRILERCYPINTDAAGNIRNKLIKCNFEYLNEFFNLS